MKKAHHLNDTVLASCPCEVELTIGVAKLAQSSRRLKKHTVL